MKKITKLFIPFALLIPSFFVFNKNVATVKATSNRPEYNIPLLSGEAFDYDNQVFDDFDNGINQSNWWLKNKAWANTNGRWNGGTIPDNVLYDSTSGTVILRATGDYYAENSLSKPAGTSEEYGRRTGADLIYKEKTYPGRYEVRMKVAPRYGVCSSMWTYIEYGNHISGVGRNNHEIDIELPYSGNFKELSFGNYTALDEHTSQKIFVDSPLNDGQFHTYAFDWYYNDNTNHKLIRYYVDGVLLCTINKNIPYLASKLNIGVWVPDSVLAGTPPRFDKAYAEIDYFKYIPFANNHVESAVYDDEPSNNPYVPTSGHVATSSQYPTSSSHNLVRNYFPNGSFDYVKKLGSSNWTNNERTGIENENVTIAKTTYDRNSSSNSGGACIANNGYLAGYIDSCFKGQKYNLSLDYRYQGYVNVTSYNADDQVISTQRFDLDASSSWATFNQPVTLNADNVAYISVSIHNSEVSQLWVDNIYLTLDVTEQQPEEPEEVLSTQNHFMTIFHNNPQVLSAFNLTAPVSATSSRANNFTISNMDYTSNIAWKISTAKYEYKSTDYMNSITLGSSSSQLDTSLDENYLWIYNAVNNQTSLNGYQAVMYSTSEIQDLHDISLSWGSVDYGKIFVCYKLHNSNWQFLAEYTAKAKNDGTDNSSTFNRRQLIIDSDNDNFVTALQGKTAQIGFLYSDQQGGAESKAYIRLQSLVINKINSIKAKIDYWSGHSTNLCGASGSLLADKSLEKFDLLMTNYHFDVNDANELDVDIEGSGAAKEKTYYDEFVYLCNIAGIQPGAAPTSLIRLSNENNVIGTGIIIIVAIFAIALTCTVVFIEKNKKKEN